MAGLGLTWAGRCGGWTELLKHVEVPNLIRVCGMPTKYVSIGDVRNSFFRARFATGRGRKQGRLYGAMWGEEGLSEWEFAWAQLRGFNILSLCRPMALVYKYCPLLLEAAELIENDSWTDCEGLCSTTFPANKGTLTVRAAVASDCAYLFISMTKPRLSGVARLSLNDHDGIKFNQVPRS